MDAAVKGNALRRAGALAGIVAGPLFLVSAQLSSRASLGYLHELAGNSTAASRSPTTSRLIVILAVAVRDRLPRRRASSFAVVQLAFWGGAAARRLQGRYADAQWRKSRDLERVGSRDRVLVDQRPGCAGFTGVRTSWELDGMTMPMSVVGNEVLYGLIKGPRTSAII